MRFNDILVVDLEATCWEDKIPPKGQTQDIIEVGATIIDTNSLEIKNSFGMFVKPTHSIVSDFCTNLTTIKQSDVDSAITFKEVCDKLKNEYKTSNQVFASYGNFDRELFRKQCAREKVQYPFNKTHINVKNLVALAFNMNKEFGVMRALDKLDLEFEGTLHRGIDDSFNIAKILIECLKDLRK